MTHKRFRYTHETSCNGGITKDVKRRAKPTSEPIKDPSPAREPSPPPRRSNPIASNPLQERYNRIVAKKESYKKLAANVF